MKLRVDANKVLRERLAVSMGLDKYQLIMDWVQKTNIAADADFQRTFNGFYLVRRNEAWRKVYYDLFEQVKRGTPTFAEILTHLYEHTGNIEPSFSSKMLATICPDKPIWDKYVLQNLGLELLGDSKQEKLENAVHLYTYILEWYEKFMVTEEAGEWLAAFDAALPEYTWLSYVKKIDCILWSIR